MHLRVRGPSGVVNITLPDTSTVADLKDEISKGTSLPSFDLRSGYPSQPLDLEQFDPSSKLLDTGLKINGEQLIATPRDAVEALRHSLTHEKAKPQNGNGAASLLGYAVSTTKTTFSSTTSNDLASPPPKTNTTLKPLSLTRSPTSINLDDPPEIPIPTLSSTLILRVMPDDNSCLFRAFSSATLGSGLDSMHELRSLIASTIASQPTLYTTAILEKQPPDYCRWIQLESSWGGAIELGILSLQFDVEVCSINVQDLRIDRFNEGCPKRVILVYSGIHYDVVALSPSDAPYTHADLPAELDTKVFDSDRGEILEGAVELCRELRKRHYFTDTKGFEVRCNVCGWRGRGEKGATVHAKGTGHMDFGEA